MENSGIKNGFCEELIIKFLAGKTSLEEEKELYAWIGNSEQNLQQFNDFREVWLASLHKTSKLAINVQNAWQNIDRKLSISKKIIQLKPEKKNNTYSVQYFMKVAAVIVIVFISGVLSSRFLPGLFSSSEIAECEVVTPLGSKTFMILPDGSQVWLNAGSKLKYGTAFNKEYRKVYLQGEAFFKVKTNKQKPFIVSTGKVDVQALGTSFNVKAYPEEKIISATLVEGVIKVNGLGENQFSYTLKPKENITIVKSSECVEISGSRIAKPKEDKDIPQYIPIRQSVKLDSRINTEIYTSWKDNLWTIEGEPLGSLAILFERRFNVKIHIESEELKSYRFTGTIRNETFEQVLQFLRYTAPLEYKIGKGETWWRLDNKMAPQYSRILNKKNNTY